MSNIQQRYDILAQHLELVARDLQEYAMALRMGKPEWAHQWSTYSLEAQTAVYNQLEQDGVMPPEVL